MAGMKIKKKERNVFFCFKWQQWVGCGQKKKSQEIYTELIRHHRKSKMGDSTGRLELKVKRDFTLRRQQCSFTNLHGDAATEWHSDKKKNL